MFLERINELQKFIECCEYSTSDEIISDSQAIRIFHSLLLNVKKNQGIAYLIGNGGSAGIASHFSIDFLNACQVPSNTLFDSNIMTCISNDYGYEHVFSTPLKTLITSRDLVIAISSSGNSSNIINAVEVAKSKSSKIITLSGFLSTNPLKKMGDLNFWLNVSDYGLVETGHFFLLHTIVDAWKSNKFLFNNLKRDNIATESNQLK